MECHKCPQTAVITLQHGTLCSNHFQQYFEDKVFRTINTYRLLQKEDKVCVAASGGKDSLTVLYLAQKYFRQRHWPVENITVLAIDEGIQEYREHTLKDLKTFCTEYSLPLNIVSNKEEFGQTLDEAFPRINPGTKKKPCNICGVWRRYLINKYAREMGATKVVTGHNLDDEAQAIIMNLFKANTDLIAHLGPVSGVKEHPKFVSRVKPLYLCPEKESRLYAFLKNFTIEFTECPYARQGYRAKIQDMLNAFEAEYPGTKQGIVKSFLDLLPKLKESELKKESEPIQECERCGEPAHHKICNACTMAEVIANA